VGDTDRTNRNKSGAGFRTEMLLAYERISPLLIFLGGQTYQRWGVGQALLLWLV